MAMTKSVVGFSKARDLFRMRPDSKLYHAAGNVGSTRQNLEAPRYCRRPGPNELMPLRLERLGLDSAYVKLFYTSTFQDLQRICASCRAWQLCGRDLAAGDVQSGMESYCLNAPTIDALLLERPPWASS
jgi:hypothetical protein